MSLKRKKPKSLIYQVGTDFYRIPEVWSIIISFHSVRWTITSTDRIMDEQSWGLDNINASLQSESILMEFKTKVYIKQDYRVKKTPPIWRFFYLFADYLSQDWNMVWGYYLNELFSLSYLNHRLCLWDIPIHLKWTIQFFLLKKQDMSDETSHYYDTFYYIVRLYWIIITHTPNGFNICTSDHIFLAISMLLIFAVFTSIFQTSLINEFVEHSYVLWVLASGYMVYFQVPDTKDKFKTHFI